MSVAIVSRGEGDAVGVEQWHLILMPIVEKRLFFLSSFLVLTQYECVCGTWISWSTLISYRDARVREIVSIT